MKFSQKRKNKIRKNNQRRINRCCGNMIGCCIDFAQECEVIDQAKIDGIMYLLVEEGDSHYAIYKIVKVLEYVRISEKKVLQNQKAFSNQAYWKKNSMIKITADGKIESVITKNGNGPYKVDMAMTLYILQT